MKRTESIKRFLRARAPEDLAELYGYEMEVQVNVGQDGGERYDGEYKGRQFTAWTDGSQVWKSFRVPWRAATDPEYEDRRMTFDLAAHAEAIGMTGWNWKRRESVYVAYDFDSIVNHNAGLNEDELHAVLEHAKAIPWVTVRTSTSGSGYHLYVRLATPVKTETHTEHAGLARAILAKMSGEVGYDFEASVDAVGGNIWVWARKYEDSKLYNSPGLSLVKQGEDLTTVPMNWRDHISVTSRKSGKSDPHFIADNDRGLFDQVCGKYVDTPLDDGHKALMKELDALSALWWWDSDRHMLVCHTRDLELCHTRLGMRGVFQTIAEGKEQGVDQNCFAFPTADSSWVVRRHSKGVEEAETWDTDGSGWTRTYLNRLPDFEVAMACGGGLEDEKEGYVFTSVRDAKAAILSLGATLSFPPQFEGREITVKRHKTEGKLIVSVKKADIDGAIEGWLKKKSAWMKVVSTKRAETDPEELCFDDFVRHLVVENNTDAGWVLRSNDGYWVEEPLSHIRLGLKSQGHSPSEVDQIMGTGVMDRWRLTNTPFEVEYPGNKVWNRDGVQYAVQPALDPQPHPTWDNVLEHVGHGLNYIIQDDEWCKSVGVVTGADYLRLWLASLFQEPAQPLPYLFLYGPQGSGKSILHEATSLLLTGGVVRADSALASTFNGEVANAVLCVIEETDFRKNKTNVYNRLKDWTVSETISIHRKGMTPFDAKNYTHWIQCSNDIEALPIFPGDTRVTMVHVDMLEEGKYVGKKEMLKRLADEASDMLGTLLAVDLPGTNDRFNVPVVITPDKLIAEQTNQNDLEAFIEESCHYTPGFGMPWKEFYEEFQEHLHPTKRPEWSKRRTGQLLPSKFCKGRYSKDDSQFWVGNLSTKPLLGMDELPSPCRVVDDRIVGLFGRVS